MGFNGEDLIGESVRHVATKALIRQLGFQIEYYPARGPFSRLFLRAAVANAAAEELDRLKK